MPVGARPQRKDPISYTKPLGCPVSSAALLFSLSPEFPLKGTAESHKVPFEKVRFIHFRLGVAIIKRRAFAGESFRDAILHPICLTQQRAAIE